MGKKNKHQLSIEANRNKRWATIGKNPHVVDMKFESGIHKLDYHILPIIFIPYNQMHHHLHKLATPLVL
jgi:hypothetical protein